MKTTIALIQFGLIVLYSIARADQELVIERDVAILSQEDCERTRLLPDYERKEIGGKTFVPTRKNLESCYGIYYNRDDILSACIMYPIDFNKKCLNIHGNGTGLTPLTYAVMNLNERAVYQLIEHRADARLGHLVHHIPFGRCRESNDLPACRSILHALLEHGAEINDPRSWDDQSPSDTPLLIVGRSSNLNSINMLLDAGADINATTEGDCTALDEAIDRNNQKLIVLLEGRGGHRGATCRLRRSFVGAIFWFRCVFIGGCSLH